MLCQSPSRSVLRSIATLAVLVATVPAFATPTIRNAFTARYPTSTLIARTQAATGNACYVCHQPTSMSATGNCYRRDLTARIAAGRTAAQAVADLDAVDSDGDGVPNGVEITTPRTDMPGQIGYNPGLVGATGTDPCATSTTTPVTGQPESVPAVCAADYNADGIVDFFVYLDFLDAFTLGGMNADFNADGVVDFFDYLDFIDAFTRAC